MTASPAGQNDERPTTVKDDLGNDTLKYQLLGPSLTKAGQDAVDQQKVRAFIRRNYLQYNFVHCLLADISFKVSEIIYNASKGSKYFNHEQQRDRNLTAKIERILNQKARLEKLDMTHELRRADEYIAELERTRDLSQYVIHVDCDAFFAAVEELDRPELKTVPMAVGKGVLTTCNYLARKYGVRSGMASFVARKLCPQLVLLPQNHEKYSAKAQEIRNILAEYDPLFESASIDEAYLNITAYCAENQLRPDEAVQRMRAEILQTTHVSVSAGIAANAKIAKIASNKNKPNGQFRVPNDRQAIMDFMRDLPVRNVNGIGRVFERELESIGIKNCGDIFPNRGLLSKLFGEKAFQFLAQCYLGLGRTRIEPVGSHERKSVGTESTFNEIRSKEEFRAKLRWAADALEKDLIRTQFKGRTLILKVKLHTFEVLTRQTAPPHAVFQAKDLYNFALPMLAKLEKDIPDMKLRLLGLRCTNLVSMKKVGIDFFVTAAIQAGHTTADNCNHTDEHEIDAEEAFESAARQEMQAEINEFERLGRKADIHSASSDIEKSITARLNTPHITQWQCPICSRPQVADDRIFNDHVDYCLSRETIREAAQMISEEGHAVSSALKRKTPSQKVVGETDSRQKRLAFR